MLEWKINVVRIPLNEDCWLGINGVSPSQSGEVYRNAITTYTWRLGNFGIYSILDLHWTHDGTGLANGQQAMPNRDNSINFWQSVSAHYHS